MARTTVLVVEDDPLIRLDAATLLEAAGLDVVAMDNADDAFAYTVEQSDGVAAIFTDVRMAGEMDGSDLAKAVAVAFPKVAVLVTSGAEVRGDLPANVRFLPKPWLPLDVLTAMQDAAA